MTDQSRALVHAVTGPIILITVGSLFALDKFSGYPFHQTWPVLIIVIGMLKLFGGGGRSRRKLAAYQAAQAAANYNTLNSQPGNFPSPNFPQTPASPVSNTMTSPPPSPGVRQ